MKPKIAVFTRPLDRGVSGSGMHLERILRAALALPEASGFDFYFVHYKPRSYDFYATGTEVIIPRNPFAAAAKLRPFRFAVAHYNPLTIFSPLGLPGTKLCATIHGNAEHFDPGSCVWIRKFHARKIVPAYARRMDLIYVVSKATRAYVEDVQRVPREKIRLTYNACDDRFAVLPEADLAGVREKYAGGHKFMLVLGNFSARKNPWASLSAFAKVAGRTDLHLVIVGNGWSQSPEVGALIRKHGLADRVHLAGFVPTEDVPRLMNLAQVFLFPSLAEGFGMPNLEAMACGCPVVTSDIPAVREVVGDCAIRLPNPCDSSALAEKILTILNDDNLRAELRRRGLKRAKEFSWQQSGRELLRGYSELLNSSPWASPR